MCVRIWKTQSKQLNSENSTDLEKPWPELLALALGYAEPGQSPCWAVTNGLAGLGLNRLGLAWLLAQSRARHIPTVE